MTLLFWVATSYIVASMIYTIGVAWWSAFIWAAVWAIAITVIAIINKKCGSSRRRIAAA